CGDINALVAAIAAGGNPAAFDLDGNGLVDGDDITAWLGAAGEANLGPGLEFLPGDATLDGTVDGQDFLAWNDHKFTADAGWCGGDFNGDGTTDGGDFLLWNKHKFTSSDQFAVPEPTGPLLVVMGLLAFVSRRRS
ncbi:MAG: PEP-CTERM sorting domain-containing protein, partial [Planctomycetota bacterium]